MFVNMDVIGLRSSECCSDKELGGFAVLVCGRYKDCDCEDVSLFVLWWEGWRSCWLVVLVLVLGIGLKGDCVQGIASRGLRYEWMSRWREMCLNSYLAGCYRWGKKQEMHVR